MVKESPASIVYDVSGHPIGVIVDGIKYRLQVEAKLAPNTIVGIDEAVTGGLALDTTVNSINNKLGNLGQKNMTGSAPVVISSDQSAIPITGSITATNPSVSINNIAISTSSTQIGGSDGTNLQAVRVFDADTGGGTQYVLGTTLRKSASGGSVEAGTSSDPIRIDPTGITTQPVSGTIAISTGSSTIGKIDQGVGGSSAWKIDGSAVTQPVNASSLPLPSGASTETTLGTRLADSTFTGRINTLGQKIMSASTPIVIASDQSAVPVTGSVTANVGTTNGLALDATLIGGTVKSQIYDGSNVIGTSAHPVKTDPTGTTTQPVSGTITANAGTGTFAVSGTVTSNIGTTNGLALDATLTDGTQRHKVTDGTNNAAVKAASIAAVATDPALVVAISPNNSVAITAASLPLPSGTATETTLGTRLADSTFTNRINTQGQKAMSASTPVVLASDQSAITVSGTVTANIGTANGLALDATLTGGTVRTKVTDGTNNAAVKAASTAPIATDPALVVAISPNSSITATNPSVSTNNAAIPTSSTQIGGSDGTNLQAARVFDADTGGGTQYVLGVGLRKSASGGSVDFGTSSDPIRIDTTGTTTQPVSGTITANIGTSGSLALDATVTKLTIAQSAALGSNTQSLIGGSVTTAAPTYTTGNINPLSLTTAGALRTDSSSTTQPVSGTVTSNQGTAVSVGNAWPVKISDGTDTVGISNVSGSKAIKVDVIQSVGGAGGTSSTYTSAFPSTGTAAGFNDGSNMQGARVFDADSGAGTQYVLGTVLRKSASGGSVEAGTVSDPFRIDPTGTTTQPVSGTITANIGTTNGLALDATLTGGTVKAQIYDGTNVLGTSSHPVRVDTTGTTTQPISVSSLPLPTGAATETTLATLLASSTFTGRINTQGQKTMSVSTPVVLASDQSTLTVSGTVTSNIGTTNGLALDSTLAKLTIAQSTALGSNTQSLIGGSVTTAAPAYTTGNINPLSLTTAGALRVDNSGTTQPVSGTVTSNIGTTNGLALDATLTGGTVRTKITDGATNTAVKAASTAAGATDPALVVAISPNNSVAITAASLPLPSGAATETTLGTRLADSTFTTRINTQGQKAMSASTPVVLASDQSTITISGAVTANIGTSGSLALDATVAKLTVAQSAALGANTQVLIGGSVTTAAPTYTTGNINPLSLTTAGALRTDSSGVTQPVSGTVTSNIGTTNGLALDATLTGGTQRTKITDGTNNAAVKAASTAALTADPALVVAVSPNNSVAVTAASLPLPAGAATETTLGTRLADSTFTGRINTQGQKAMAASTPVVLASDQSTLTVSGTVTSNIGTTNGLALDATLAKLTVAQSAALGSNTQTLIGGSVTTSAPTYTTGNVNPLSLTTTGALRVDNSGITQPVSGTVTANIGTTNGLALDSSISTLSGKFGSLGQKTMAGSAPVVLASDQSAVPVSGTIAATQSSTWTVQPGNTANTTPWLTTINQGGNSASVTGANALKVDGSAVTQPVSGTVTSNIGTTNGLALDATLTGGTQRSKITDGTNNAAVKAASTAAVATDPALVVAVSPNNTVKVQGSETIGNAPVGNPLMFGYLDVNGNVRYPTFNQMAGGGFGGLTTYSNVTTDLESYRDDFDGTNLQKNLTGTVTFTNGSKVVTGVGTAFTSQLNTADIYIRLSTDTDSNLTKLQFQPYYEGSDTLLTLSAPYPGNSGSGTGVYTKWFQSIGTGGAIVEGTAPAVASEIAISTGSTSGSYTYINHGNYVAPLNVSIYAKISQRNAGQEFFIGLTDSIASPTLITAIVFSGATNNTVSLRTSENGITIENNTATLPNKIITDNYQRYRLLAGPDSVILFVNDIEIIRNKQHLQPLYNPLPLTIGAYNLVSGMPNSTLFIDTIGIVAHDQVMVALENTAVPVASQIFGYDALGLAQQTQVFGATQSLAVSVLDSTGNILTSPTYNGTPNLLVNNPQANNKLDQIQLTLTDISNALSRTGGVIGVGSNTSIIPRTYQSLQFTFVASTSAIQMLTTNTLRMGATFVNDSASTGNLYLLLGASLKNAVSATNYSKMLKPGDYWEIPFFFSGRIDGLWSNTTGNVYITELCSSNI